MLDVARILRREISPAVAAKRYRVHACTVRRWCRAGTLPARRMPGGGWRIDPSLWDSALGLVAIAQKHGIDRASQDTLRTDRQ
jgi:excisionase family DNA binding protein